MLFLAEGSVRGDVSSDQKAAMQAWFGPMVDDGVLQAGWLDHDRNRVWLVLSAEEQAAVETRLDALPLVTTRQVEFEVFRVEPVRFR
jgi:hypothetical protein